MSDEIPDDYRLLYDDKWLRVHHLGGKPVVVTIESVFGAELVGEGGQKSKKPGLKLKGKQLPFAICKTDGKTIGSLYGKNPRGWIGKQIELYPTTTRAKQGETVECIRVRKPQ